MTLTQEDFSVSDIRDVSRKVRPLVTEKKFTSALSVLPCYVADPGHMDSYFVVCARILASTESTAHLCRCNQQKVAYSWGQVTKLHKYLKIVPITNWKRMCFCSFARCKYQFSWRDGGSVHLLQPWPQRAAPDQVSLRQASARVPQFWR